GGRVSVGKNAAKSEEHAPWIFNGWPGRVWRQAERALGARGNCVLSDPDGETAQASRRAIYDDHGRTPRVWMVRKQRHACGRKAAGGSGWRLGGRGQESGRSRVFLHTG